MKLFSAVAESENPAVVSSRPLVLGTAALGMPYGLPRLGGRGVDAETVASLLQSLTPQTCAALDTAPAYGDAESRVGRYAPSWIPIWTKVAADIPVNGQLASNLERSLEQSLDRLRRDHLALWQWHSWSRELLEKADFVRAWQQFRGDQRIQSLGCSTYGVADALSAVRCGLFDWVQVEWNPLRTGVVRAVGPQAQQQGVKLSVRSVFLQGVLANAEQPLPSALAALQAPRAALAALAPQFDTDLPGLCIQAAQHHPHIHAVLIGARDREEWRSACQRSRQRFDGQALLAAIADFDRGDDPLCDPARWPAWERG